MRFRGLFPIQEMPLPTGLLFYMDYSLPPAGDLFLPSVSKCHNCEGSGIYKMWGRFDVKCYVCTGTGEDNSTWRIP